MQLISKHFYSEWIFDDSTSNTPKLRWRYRNFFSDNVINGSSSRTQDYGSYDKSQEDTQNDSYEKSQGYSESYEKSQGKSENITDSKRTTLQTKNFFVSIVTLSYTYSLINHIDALDGSSF